MADSDRGLSYQAPSSLWALYVGFLSIGARSFGGVLPWAHRVLVEEKRWIAPAEFAEVLALCQFLPGPNVGNVSVVLGRRWFGLPGALVAFAGLMALPFVWVLALAVLYGDYAGYPAVKAVVTGVGIAGAGLFIGTAFKLCRPLATKPAALAIVAGCFLSVGIARVSLLYVLPIAIALAWLAATRKLA
ncbi:MAG: chromate transporter [Betaproteobacteria bacterium]